MKKSFISLAICAVVCMGFSSCGIRNFVKDLKAVAEEAEEISEGKYFTIEAATVTYTDGTVLMFSNYGKNARLETKDEVVITDGETLYALDTESKTYSMEEYEASVAAAFCVPEKTMSAGEGIGKWASDVEIVSTTRTIAGKECMCWTVDGESIASWHRVLMLGVYDDEEETPREAKSVIESVDRSLLSVPADYKLFGEED